MADETSVSRELAEFLASDDVPCPGCGYNLRGLTASVCPECRLELKLKVGLAEPRIDALVACVGPLFAGAGAAGAMFLTIVVVSIRYGDWPSGRMAMVLLGMPMACLVMCVVPAVAMSVRRGRVWFRGLSRWARGGVMVASISLPVVWFLAFLALVFRF